MRVQTIQRCSVQQCPVICGLAFRGFSYPRSTAIRKYYTENSILYLKFLCSTACHSEQRDGLAHCPARDVTHPSAHSIHALHAPRPLVMQPLSQLSDPLMWYRRACVQVTLTLLINGPKVKGWHLGWATEKPCWAPCE